MTSLIILIIVGLLGVFVCLYLCDKYNDNLPIIAFFFGGIFGILLLNYIAQEIKPSAIDVYRGKTTLEITYKDGIPTDTVVVFKEKF